MFRIGGHVRIERIEGLFVYFFQFPLSGGVRHTWDFFFFFPWATPVTSCLKLDAAASSYLPAPLSSPSALLLQSALLYTSAGGQRRVRCHTLGLPVTGLLPNIFRSTGKKGALSGCVALLTVVCTVSFRSVLHSAPL